MTSYALLDQAEEDALHKSRLLNVEEKPFRRITKRLLTPNSLITTPPTHLPTPPPDASAADEAAAAFESDRQRQIGERQQWREDVLLDFAAFESSIARIQFLRTSNEKERERYAAEKLKIQATAQAVRENTAELRVQLEEAQKTLALRKTYDELAEKITNNRLLRPREDQHANLDKLNAEIADLEKESRDYAQTWSERREQFGRIVEEGMQLRRLIRDEKEEVERREGMEERDEGEEGEVGSQRGRSSTVGTPRPDAGGVTPMHTVQDSEGSTPGGLSVDKQRTPRARSHLGGSRASTPAREEQRSQAEADEDTTMAEDGGMMADNDVTTTVSHTQPESGEPSDSHAIKTVDDMVAAPPEGLVDANDEKEEGEEDEGTVQDGGGDNMDTT
ncbi:MAG: hypothetical protein M1830_009023 [Pleopsidium flavum]|nr:MAG: hypothetical protein M1830_010626 [Pleopsidium flavum]KAI9875024.1 MAG: hypothetical protein M1830_009023 [Pleopsidium flavum]